MKKIDLKRIFESGKKLEQRRSYYKSKYKLKGVIKDLLIFLNLNAQGKNDVKCDILISLPPSFKDCFRNYRSSWIFYSDTISKNNINEFAITNLYLIKALINLNFLSKLYFNIYLRPVILCLDILVKRKIKYQLPKIFVFNVKNVWNNYLAYHLNREGVKVIYLQHGIYQLSMHEIDEISRNYVDYHFVIGDLYKDFYENNGFLESTIFNVGVRNMYAKNSSSSSNFKKLVFYGMPTNIFGEESIIEYIKLVNFLIFECKKVGITFLYKPHPQETEYFLKRVLPDNILQDAIKYKKFKPYEMVDNSMLSVSVLSTVLYELAANNYPAIQIEMETINHDNFEHKEICKSFRIDDFDLKFLLDNYSQIQVKFNEYNLNYNDYYESDFRQAIDYILHG